MFFQFMLKNMNIKFDKLVEFMQLELSIKYKKGDAIRTVRTHLCMYILYIAFI